MKMHRMVLALVATISGLASIFHSPHATANQYWTLTNEQRRAYLHYYAPVIFKRANENGGKKGYDWIHNFDFDQDGYFSTNLANGQQLPSLVAAAAQGYSGYAAWRLRPTLYTALIEFKGPAGKELVLLYHIYHAMDQQYINPWEDSSRPPDKIHDWERVEIHLKNVGGSPGSGEAINYVVVTQHHQHVVRTAAQAKFMDTPTGKHVMVWQAEWSSRTTAPRGAELRFVEDSYSYISSRWNQVVMANVDVNNDGRKNVHYVFVPDQEPGAVSASGAKTLSYTTAEKLASGWDNGTTISWNGVKRITYELQDVADIIPSNWSSGGYQPHWGMQSDELIKFGPEGLVNESGLLEIPGGAAPETFYTAGLISTGGTDREGFPSKSWLWGTYNMDDSACNATDQIPNGCPGRSFNDAALTGTFLDWQGIRRQDANGLPGSATTDPETSFWWQHDYFVHHGYTDESDDYAHRCTTGSLFVRLQCREDYRNNMDPGYWLTGPWYTAAYGGFDGRWVQLFDDRTGEEPYTPLEVELVGASSGCAAKTVRANVSGGRSPYTVTWVQWVGYQTSAPHSSWNFAANARGELQVVSSDGQSLSYTVHCPVP